MESVWDGGKSLRPLRQIGKYCALMLAVALVACALQFLAGLVPQEAVRKNLLASMDQLRAEGLAPGVLYEGHPRSLLDNLSENYILTYSYYLDTRTDPAAVLTNPGRQIQDPYAELFEQTGALLEQKLPSDTNYVRYWLGFRMYVRPMLAVMNYMDARQCIQWGFYLLLAAVTIMLYRQTRSALTALAFPLAISQLNPLVISACFQYSACFYIALIGMLLVPVVRGKRFTMPMLFLTIGMVTQIMDFYTAPLITFGLPALALLLRADGSNWSNRARWKLLGACLLGWFCGYVGAWLLKMLLTTLLTPYNALYDGLSRLAFWLNPAGGGAAEPWLALKAIFYCCINVVDLVPLLVAALILLLYAVRLIRHGVQKERFSDSLIYLFIAALPFVWFAAAARPSYEQFYFQYRSLGMTLFSGMIFLLRTAGWDELLPETTPSTEENGQKTQVNG